MSEQEHATRLLQALADPTRLRLVAALLEQPACVEELAERLGLSAPTISHHLGKLDQAGLLNRRREQYYTVCEARPGPLARTLRELVATAADQPGAEEARQHLLRQRLLATFFENGRLRQLPAQRKKRRVVLAAFAADFAVDRDYAEPEVNEIIARRFADYCTIRRELVDDRLLSRAKTSGQLLQYRRTGEVPVAALPWPIAAGDAPGTSDSAGITRMKGNRSHDGRGQPGHRGGRHGRHPSGPAPGPASAQGVDGSLQAGPQGGRHLRCAQHGHGPRAAGQQREPARPPEPPSHRTEAGQPPLHRTAGRLEPAWPGRLRVRDPRQAARRPGRAGTRRGPAAAGTEMACRVPAFERALLQYEREDPRPAVLTTHRFRRSACRSVAS
ncbi:MAG: metalloregulator ArsR/SmtB family transcription factor [bacterium]|nr:metalloregulator ArsR/SmtB family transcription factor [bacterium]